MKLISFSDGGARGNPGPAGIGAVLFNDKNEIVEELSFYLGETTNNQAEYRALIMVMKKAQSLGATELECYLDSELVVKQLKGEYKVKHPDLKPLFEQAKSLISQIKNVSFKHIRRELNKQADQLANQAMDRGGDF